MYRRGERADIERICRVRERERCRRVADIMREKQRLREVLKNGFGAGGNGITVNVEPAV